MHTAAFQLDAHLIERAHQKAQLIAALQFHILMIIAYSDLASGLGQPRQRLHQALCHAECSEYAQQHAQAQHQRQNDDETQFQRVAQHGYALVVEVGGLDIPGQLIELLRQVIDGLQYAPVASLCRAGNQHRRANFQITPQLLG